MERLGAPLVLSADTAQGVAARAAQLRAHLEDAPDEPLADVVRRSLAADHARWRGAVLGSGRSEVLRGLAELSRGRTGRDVLTGSADLAASPVLVFPGQGVQWPGMAGELLATSAGFRTHVGRAGAGLRDRLGWDPGAALSRGQELTRLATIQPVQFVLASGLERSWRDVGLRPAAVVGHSVGEVGAARACGALSDEDAAALIALCSAAFTRIEGRGAMAAVAAAAERVLPLLHRWPGRLELAAVNGPRNVTVSGDPDAVADLLSQLERDGIWAWLVPGVDVAGHSSQIDVLREMVLEGAPRTPSGPRLSPGTAFYSPGTAFYSPGTAFYSPGTAFYSPGTAFYSPGTAFYSAVTGSRLAAGDLTPEHWFRTLRDRVLFEQAVRALVADGHRLFVELSSHPVLTTVIEETLRSLGATGVVIPTLDRRMGDRASFLRAVTRAFVNGVGVDWDVVHDQLLDPVGAVVVADGPAPSATGDATDLAALGTVTPSEQRRILLDLVAEQTQAVVGHAFDSGTQSFRDIGLTSLTVVELAAALSVATGLDLPPTLVFDHPTPVAVVEHLRAMAGLIGPAPDQAAGPVPDQAAGPAPDGAPARTDDPIAIVGIGCRYPGGVTSADALWQLVLAGRDAIGEHPDDRGWDTTALYDPAPGRPGRISTRYGGYLADVAGFDAGFFGLSPREATSMEPQQRLLLEVCWETIEHARIDPDALRGTNTGVFAGVIAQEYGPRLQQAPANVAGYAFLGTAGCLASGRIAYSLGLEGPAITMDTACSSSLVAIHEACEALRSHGCDLALAGGATVMSTPGVQVDFSQQRVLAPDGRCKPFSAAADGIGLSEGVGMVLLERLSDAEANGHRVLAVIRGSAINQDGASNGLTAPSGTAQQRVIRRALANAGLSAQDVDAVEAHGTGTPLGDPIEAHALLATYGRRDPAGPPVRLGSIKSNVGHTQAAAGVAGLIKMVMALRHGVLPRTLHLDAPSPHVDWSSGSVRLLDAQERWPDVDDRPRRAAVSSFGVSGTNSHLILQEAPAAPPAVSTRTSPPEAGTAPTLWPLSARTEPALRAQAARLHRHVLARPDLDPTDVAYSLASSRARFAHRAVVRGRSRDELLDELAALAGRRREADVVRAVAPAAGPHRLVFVFPGQGSQWPGMGLDLYAAFPAFRRALDRADEALRRVTGWSVLDVLRELPDAPALTRVDVAQPALFAVLTSLARLWESFGLTPDAVVGHSQGEIAAAHVAGALTLDDAAALVALRSRLLVPLADTGAMATLALSEDRTRSLLAEFGRGIDVAAVNSPTSTVVSGDEAAIAALLRRCHATGLRGVRLDVDVAGHSPVVDPLRAELLEIAAGITPRPTRVPLYSTVDGRPHDVPVDGTTLDAGYWFDNLRRTVRFADTLRAMADRRRLSFLECSPHPSLLPAIEETLDDVLSVGTLHSGRPPAETLGQSLARLHAAGHEPRWRSLYPDAAVVDLPTYPFERRRYWLDATPAGDVAAAGQRAGDHPLLPAAIELPDDEGLLLTGRLGLGTQAWLADHAAAGVVLLPGTAYLDLAVHAADRVGYAHVAELTLRTPMVLPEQGARDLQVRVGPPEHDGDRSVTLHSRPAATDDADSSGWTLHATARLTRSAPARPGPADDGPWPPEGSQPVELAALRRRLAEAGYEYGPAFTGLRAAWRAGDRLFVEAELPDELAPAGYTVHPALLDTLLHPIALADAPDALADAPDTVADAPADVPDGRAGLRLPFSFTGITAVGVAGRQLRASLRRTAPDRVSVLATDDTGAPVLTVDELALRPTTADNLRTVTSTGPGHDLLQLTWSPPSLAEADPDEVTDLRDWILVSPDPDDELTAAVPRRDDLAELVAAIGSGSRAPDVIVWRVPPCDPADAADVPRAVRDCCERTLEFLQAWLAHADLGRTKLVALTRRAVATGPHEEQSLTHGPAWGLLQSAQNEHPGRIVLVDTDRLPPSPALLATAVLQEHPAAALRDGRLYLPHLARSTSTKLLTPPPESPTWRLEATTAGGLDNLALVPAPDAAAPLLPGQLRIDVRAAGMNFYDTVCALGLVARRHGFGAEAAGIVTEVGPGVERFAVGDRVMVLTEGAFGPIAVAEQRMSARIPDGWSFAQAAGVPVAFVTAYYALVDLAGIRAGDKVLIHSAAGGLGQAAAQLARHLGAEPFGTAHPSKWDTLRGLGYADDHLASSRTLEFAETFRPTGTDRGMDIVLNSLAGPFTDASLDLLAPGGRFIELGKTDVRDPQEVTGAHPAVTYQCVDRPGDAGPDRTAEILDVLLPLFHQGVLTPLPVTAYGIRDATAAFRLMQNARHTGKLVLTLPRRLDPDGTVLITGGTGTLGGLLARHLVTAHQVRHLVLVSRSGPRAAGADTLRADLVSRGAQVTVIACDTSDRQALARVLADIPPQHPLTGVFHTAGRLADATVTRLAPKDFDAVLTPKADTAWHLHGLVEGLDPAVFVLYSSTSGVFGNPGQGNYTAANAFLDALARHRARRGLPVTSLGWGWWQPVTGMSQELTQLDNTRIARSGLAPITEQHGHALLDAALDLPHPVLTATPLNQQVLRANSSAGTLHPLLNRLVNRTVARRVADSTTPDLRKELLPLAPDARADRLRALITAQAAIILGLDSSVLLPADQPFTASGFDSLTALELRNRLTSATGLRLPASVTYDFPTPAALAAHLADRLLPAATAERPASDGAAASAGAGAPAASAGAGAPAAGGDAIDALRAASLEELVAIALATPETA